MPNTFDWIEIKTRDIEEVARFYEGVFGWRMIDEKTADGGAVWIFDTGDKPRIENLRRGGLWSRPADDALGVIVYIVVDDIEATLEKVVGLGGEIVGPKTPQGSAFRATFADPNGNILGLWEEPSSGAP